MMAARRGDSRPQDAQVLAEGEDTHKALEALLERWRAIEARWGVVRTPLEGPFERCSKTRAPGPTSWADTESSAPAAKRTRGPDGGDGGGLDRKRQRYGKGSAEGDELSDLDAEVVAKFGIISRDGKRYRMLAQDGRELKRPLPLCMYKGCSNCAVHPMSELRCHRHMGR